MVYVGTISPTGIYFRDRLRDLEWSDSLASIGSCYCWTCTSQYSVGTCICIQTRARLTVLHEAYMQQGQHKRGKLRKAWAYQSISPRKASRRLAFRSWRGISFWDAIVNICAVLNWTLIVKLPPQRRVEFGLRWIMTAKGGKTTTTRLGMWKSP